VSIYRDNPSQIDLVLLDMVMPRLGGHGTFYQIRAIDPDAKILLSSGFVQEGAVQDLLDNGAAGFIAKPHRLPQLTKAIRDVLDGKPVSAQI
jgi:DNA-binding NarL/FixJ family response regulator